jgi:hypothetical protein
MTTFKRCHMKRLPNFKQLLNDFARRVPHTREKRLLLHGRPNFQWQRAPLLWVNSRLGCGKLTVSGIINCHNYFWYFYSTVHNTIYKCGHEPWIQDRWRNCLRHVRPSARLPLDRLKWNLVLGDSIKIRSEIPIFVILGENSREPYCTPKYVLLLLEYRYARRRLGASQGQIRTTCRVTL